MIRDALSTDCCGERKMESRLWVEAQAREAQHDD
jgi:hypothetical protein